MLFQGMFFGLYMASVYKMVAQDTLSDKSLTLIGAVGSMCNGSSRFVWAALQDIYGFKNIYVCILSM